MREINFIITCLLVAFDILVICWSIKCKSWLTLVLGSTFLVRIGLCVLFEVGGLKNVFVIDSLGFEFRGWLLAQNWITPESFALFAEGPFDSFTYYEVFLSVLFKVFGYDTMMGTLANAVMSTTTIFLVCRLKVDFFSAPRKLNDFDKETRNTALITAIILGIYPSYTVWSVTNIRDPLYFLATVSFFYFFFTAFSKRSPAPPVGRILSIGLCALSFITVLGLRSYVGVLFLVSISVGYLAVFFLKWVRLRTFLVLAAAIPLIGAYSFQYSQAEEVEKLLAQLQEMRLNFANLRLLDNVAKSSFALDHPFRTITDVLTFLPISLSHYFFGPFLWEISGFVQGISFLETACVMLLVYPAFRGLKIGYQRNRTEVTLLLSFIVAFVMAQAMAISNMGTIFRHRSLPFLFLSIFAGEGLYDIFKKNLQTFFEAQHRGAIPTRGESFGGADPVGV